MSLARAWARQLYGASGAVLLTPGAVVLAIAVLGLAGGFGQLSSLGQAFAGPSVPAAAPVPGGPTGSARAAATVPPVVRAFVPAAAPAGAGHGAAIHGAGTTTHTGTGTGTGTGTPTVSVGPGTGSGGTHPGPGSSGGHPTGGGSGSGGGSPPSLVDTVVKLGTTVTKQVPGAAGATATQLLNSVGKTVDTVVPPQTLGTVGSLTSSLQLP